MAVFSTTAGTTGTQDFEVPTQVLDPWLGKIQDASVIASLSGAIPMKIGTGEAFSFSTDEAEHVGEGASKSSTTYYKSGHSVAPQTFEKTMRFTEETLWADEGSQLEVVEHS